MRILFTFVGGLGHFDPLVPVARCAESAGHDVAFGSRPSLIPTVEAAGFRALAIGGDAGKPPTRTPLRAVDRAREDRDLRERFVRRGARYRVPYIVALCSEWQPDVLVCDETDFGAMVAADRLGLPYASVLIIAAGSFLRAEVIGAALDELRAEHDLPPDPELEMLSRYLVLSPFPPSFRDPAYPLPVTAHGLRPAMPGSDGSSPPAWSSVRPGSPTAYFTLGTVFNLESGDLLSRVLAILRDLPLNLVVTVGPDIDPTDFGPQPDHVSISRHIPQASVLPYCDLVISHGGSGSVIGALAHGLPSVLIPLGADQPMNADRCARLGVARVLDATDVSPKNLRAAVSTVLDDPALRRNAERLRDEITALPEVAAAISLLEQLAAKKQPMISQ